MSETHASEAPNGMIAETPLLLARGYPALIGMRIISSVILWVDFTLIFTTLSYHLGATPTKVGLATALYGLPGLLLGPMLGRLADRVGPFPILFGSFAARGVASLLLFAAPSQDWFIAFVFLKGLSNIGAFPAEQILLKAMLTTKQLVSSAGVMTVIDQTTKVLAPLVGAGLAGARDPAGGFLLSSGLAVGGIAVTGLIWSLRAYFELPKPQGARRASLAVLRDLMRTDKLFAVALAASLAQSLALGLYDPLLSLFLRNQGHPPSVFGLIVSCTAGGAIAGAFGFKRVFHRSGNIRLVGGALFGFGLSILVPGLLALTGLPTPVVALAALWVVNGACYGLTAMSFAVILQTRAPHSNLGTLSSTIRSIQLAALVAGPLAGSFAARSLGIPAVLAATGVAITLIAAFAGVSGVRSDAPEGRRPT